VDIEGKQHREIPIAFDPDTTIGVHWSPDGTRLALNAIDGRTKEGSITVVDLDGSNYRKLPLPPGRWNLHVCDWKVLAPGLRLEATDPPPDVKTVRGRYQTLIQEYEQAGRLYGQALKAAKTDEDRRKAYQEKFPRPRSYAGRFLQIGESAPSDPSAAEALIWVASFIEVGPEFDRAIELLAREHAAKRGALRTASSLGNKLSPTAERFLRAVVDRNPDRFIRGMACLWLGQYLKNQSQGVWNVREDKGQAAWMESVFLQEGGDKEGFERFRERDPDALMKLAEAAFERVVKEFGDIPSGRSETIGREAQARAERDPQPDPGQAGARGDRGRCRRPSDETERPSGPGGLDLVLGRLVRLVPGPDPLRAGARGADARPAVRPARRQWRRRQG